MSLEIESYNVQEDSEEGKQRFFFETTSSSTATDPLIKAIEYTLTSQSYQEKRVFNLGFGDYNREHSGIIDDQVTNNGDTYKVFNTVLHTIPNFFDKYGDCYLVVAGSDSRPDFAEKCRLKCVKMKCVDSQCIKQHQRIRNYCNYINKNFDKLNVEYEFEGGTVCEETQSTIVEPFVRGNNYHIILVKKRIKRGNNEYL